MQHPKENIGKKLWWKKSWKIWDLHEKSEKLKKKMDFKIMCDSDDKNAKNPGNIPELL